VQSQPGTFEYREVTLGYEGPKEVVVSSGLAVGEQVVSENILLLSRAFGIAQTDTKSDQPPAKAESSTPAQSTSKAPKP
jgi:cobalt-zinc-cadmium efflux system membrane fusion protein